VAKQPAAFLVHGSTAAGLVWSMVARWDDPAQPPAPGRYLWHGWWLVVADVVWPLPTDIEEALATSDHAVVVAGAAGGVRACRVSHGVVGVRSLDALPEAPELRSPAYLAEVPMRLRRRRRRKGEAADLAPQLEALLAAWGWPVKRDIDPTRTLRGATSLDPWTGESPDRHIVGERILCAEMSRWALDRADPDALAVQLEPGAFVHALWDRDNPPDPVQLWVLPKDWDDSRPMPARLEWRRRETDVVREQCRLDGQRFWAAHRAHVVKPLFDTGGWVRSRTGIPTGARPCSRWSSPISRHRRCPCPVWVATALLPATRRSSTPPSLRDIRPTWCSTTSRPPSGWQQSSTRMHSRTDSPSRTTSHATWLA